MKKITEFAQKKQKSEKISMVTCYDFSTAKIVNESSIDVILIGDSLGMVFSGYETTIPVTVDEMIYHARAVKRGAPDKLIIVDLPFLAYHVSDTDTLTNCGKILKETGCHAVKLEGGSVFADRIRMITDASIPVIGHLGLTPQSVHKLGGYSVQGRQKDDAEKIMQDALILEKSGVSAIVLEMVPEELAKQISMSLTVPTIGIGAGRFTDGQVLVINDLLGYDKNYNPKYLKKYKNYGEDILQALDNYSLEVQSGVFPGEINSF